MMLEQTLNNHDFFALEEAVCSQNKDLLSKKDKPSSITAKTSDLVWSHNSLKSFQEYLDFNIYGYLSFIYFSSVTMSPILSFSLFIFFMFLNDGFVIRELRYFLSEIVLCSSRKYVYLISLPALSLPRTESLDT